MPTRAPLTRQQIVGRYIALVVAVAAPGACTHARSARIAAPPAEPPITDGRGVLRAMHARYDGKWFTSLSFAQYTSFIGQNGRETKGVWNEYLLLPGRLRIDYTPLDSHSGVLYTGGKIHVFTDGQPQPAQSGWNPLLILLGDVYTQPVDTTAWMLDSLGFDLGIVRRDAWNDRPVWVVGAAPGDSTRSQFWIDVDSLLVRRVIQRDTRGARPVVTDARFEGYTNIHGFPIAVQMRFYRDGRLYFKEDYFDVNPNAAIPADVFNPATWVESQIQRAGKT